MNQHTPNTPANAPLAALRAGLGLYFVLAGLAKARGELTNGFGSFRSSESFLALQPAWLPDLCATPFGLALPWVEIVVGLTLAAGLFTRISALLTAAMLLSFTIALVGIAGISGGSPGPFHPNFLLLAASAIFIAKGPVAFSLDQSALVRNALRKPRVLPRPAAA